MKRYMQHLEDVAKVFINCQRLGSEFVCKKRNPSLTSHTAAPPLSNRASLRSQGSEVPEMGDEAICHFKILRPMFSFRLRDPQGSGKKMFRRGLENSIKHSFGCAARAAAIWDPELPMVSVHYHSEEAYWPFLFVRLEIDQAVVSSFISATANP